MIVSKKGFATHHDDRGVCWELLVGGAVVGRHRIGQLLITQLVHAVREALHLVDRKQHSGVFGFHCQHLAFGVERGDLLLVATDLLGQLLSKHPPQTENTTTPRVRRVWFSPQWKINSSWFYRILREGGG